MHFDPFHGCMALIVASVLFSSAAVAAPSGAPKLWPELLLQSGSADSAVGTVSMPLARNSDPRFTQALLKGSLCLAGQPVQGQTVAVWPGDEKRPRRMILRWTADASRRAGTRVLPAGKGFSRNAKPARDAGWSYTYRLVEKSADSLQWVETTHHLPIEKTEYEMYQLDLKHGGKSFGIRLGFRSPDRIYWWQFVRADFLQRGAVFDILRVGGPIYNGQSSMQSDLYLVLYANGLVEAYPHFASHRREDAGHDMNGVPVVAFDVPGAPKVDEVLDGTKPRFALGDCKLDLDYTVHMADAKRPGSLKTEGDVVVLQPWLDQQIYGEKLVDREGIPDHRIIHLGGTTEEVSQHHDRGQADRYYATTIGDKLWPIGLARSFRFCFALPGVAPDVARYQAPPWWNAMAGALPTLANLPVKWWAVPHAIDTVKTAAQPESDTGAFEYGRSSWDAEGGLGASLVTLGQATGRMEMTRDALPAGYWRADIPIHHTDFSVSEIPFYGWQWMVQPYHRWQSVLSAYWETGDPYLLETSIMTADSYYRMFLTNRPHRFVGRDSLPVEDLLDLFLTTGDRHYLECAKTVLSTARRSYEQTEYYWPGHQSGSGPNGVGRRPDYLYIPNVLAREHIKMVEDVGELLTPAEREEAMRFAAFVLSLIDTKWPGTDNGWGSYATSWMYSNLTALADWYPADADKFERTLDKYNKHFNMPLSHSGGRMHSWIVGAVKFDAWVWGATWKDGALHLKPHRLLLEDPRAPKTAIIDTPRGPAEFEYAGGTVRTTKKVAFKVIVETQ